MILNLKVIGQRGFPPILMEASKFVVIVTHLDNIEFIIYITTENI